MCDDGEDVALGICVFTFVEAIDDNQPWKSGRIDSFCVQGYEGICEEDSHLLIARSAEYVLVPPKLLDDFLFVLGVDPSELIDNGGKKPVSVVS